MDTGPLTLVICGASGDLTARKLVPSLYQLARKQRMPQELQIVGVARTAFADDAFRDRMAASVREFSADEWDEASWKAFAPRLFYVAGDAAKPGGLDTLRTWLRQHEGTENKPGSAASPGRRLFYLAVSPHLYPDIVTQLGESGLSREAPPAEPRSGERNSVSGWPRLVVEKPFGKDLASARSLNQVVRKHFREDQVYRIDHYLGKETVQNILVFRFANTLFEPLWNYNYIDHVQITVSETVAVGSRGDYYDKAGVLRDMFQNHLLQLLTLVGMEAPARFAADPLRNEKIKVLDAIPVMSSEEAARSAVTGQYAGYRQEKGVAADSRTPTYAAVQLGIDNWRWRGVPFFLRSGKALAGRLSEIVIQFRCPPHLMFPLPPGATLECNRLAMCIQPDEGIHLNFQSKVPDQGMVLAPADLEFHYRSRYRDTPIPEAYERLLQDALHGDAALFMRSDEIERAWEIMDPLIAVVEHPETVPGTPLPQEYAVGSDGPACADEFLARSGRSWLSLCHHPKKQ
jgi:glucose-6-phosphate 1-dehydrogenase